MTVLRSYLRYKAIWLSKVLEPPLRGSGTTLVDREDIELAYMDFQNAHAEHEGNRE